MWCLRPVADLSKQQQMLQIVTGISAFTLLDTIFTVSHFQKPLQSTTINHSLHR
jgi:hypothetical protein